MGKGGNLKLKFSEVVSGIFIFWRARRPICRALHELIGHTDFPYHAIYCFHFLIESFSFSSPPCEFSQVFCWLSHCFWGKEGLWLSSLHGFGKQRRPEHAASANAKVKLCGRYRAAWTVNCWDERCNNILALVFLIFLFLIFTFNSDI